MIFSLFKLFKSYKKGETREGVTDFVNEQAGEVLLLPFWIAVVIISPFFIASAIFAFFHVWGGPYGIAKFFFWFLAVALTIIALCMRAISSRSKKIFKKISDKIIT